uniref:Uncharacterized protein n=1 Tax=Siphoviridae sp. ctzpQ31 TaxID=2823613 RepID=A0A8S5L884_9CAUD|nr:MAG TPA: hypothetical protein [Siphoviridae sp. ctzpQ31]
MFVLNSSLLKKVFNFFDTSEFFCCHNRKISLSK